MAAKLKEGEEKSVQLYALAIQDLAHNSSTDNISDVSLQLTQDFKIPAILTDSKDEIIDAVNFGEHENRDTVF